MPCCALAPAPPFASMTFGEASPTGSGESGGYDSSWCQRRGVVAGPCGSTIRTSTSPTTWRRLRSGLRATTRHSSPPPPHWSHVRFPLTVRCGQRRWSKGSPTEAVPWWSSSTTSSPTAWVDWRCWRASSTVGCPRRASNRPLRLHAARPSSMTLPRRGLGVLAHLHRVPGTILAALAELRSGSAPRAARCSINRPVGARRRFATASADLKQIRAVAHADGASVNDVMLAAMGGALGKLLAHRGEHVDPFIISVPVSGRSQASAGALGNQVGVMPVAVTTSGEATTRLEAIAAATRAHKARTRGASAALLVPVFRAFGALHLLRWGVNHQHLVHTFATNLRGPDSPVSFLGATVSDIIPLNVLAGNVAVRVRRHVLYGVSHHDPDSGS